MTKDGDGNGTGGGDAPRRVIGPTEKELRQRIHDANMRLMVSGGRQPQVAEMIGVFFQVLARGIDRVLFHAATAAGAEINLVEEAPDDSTGDPKGGDDGCPDTQ